MTKSHPLRKLFFYLAVVVLALLVVRFYWNFLLSPINSDDTTKKSFQITDGQSTTVITQNLLKAGLIRSSMAFSLLVKRSGQGGKLQSGEYLLSSSMSSQEILQQFSHGEENKRVTLVEGLRVEEMANKLNQVLGIDQGNFIQVAKEGYMFPDTYFFTSENNVSDIVSAMEANFNQKFSLDIQAKLHQLGLTSDQGVILASIVEREARSDEVRQKVASILFKRLKINMALDADSTIQYALGYQKDEASWWKTNLTLDDLKVDSAFNTYTHQGLPPRPICNPSLSSLQAVAQADPSIPYLYYYHDSQGNSYYAKTLDEHNQNVANHP